VKGAAAAGRVLAGTAAVKGAAAAGRALAGTAAVKGKSRAGALICWRARDGCEVKVSCTGSSAAGSCRLSWLGCCRFGPAAAGDSDAGTAGSDREEPAWEGGTAGRKVSLGKETETREKGAGFGATCSTLPGWTSDSSMRSDNEGKVVRGTASTGRGTVTCGLMAS